jgi:glutamate carboxypeptidase
VAGSVEMALDGLGLAGTDGHTVQETADLASLGRESQRVALLLKRLAEAPRAAVGVQSTP